MAGSLIIGFSALALALSPSFPGHSDPVWFLLLLSVMIGLVGPLMRSAVPCIAAALPLGSCYIAYAVLPPSASQSWAALALGITLIIAAFGLAETVRRFWPEALAGATVARAGILLAGLATLLPFSIALGRMLSLSGNAGIGVFTLFPLVACAAVWCRQQRTASGQRARVSMAFQIAVGLLVLAGGAVTCGTSGFFPSAVAIAGLPMLALAKRVGIRHVGIAGALPILGGFITLWLGFPGAQPGGLVHDSVNLAVLLSISTGLAILLWKKIRAPRLRKSAILGDAMLHGLGIFAVPFLSKAPRRRS